MTSRFHAIALIALGCGDNRIGSGEPGPTSTCTSVVFLDASKSVEPTCEAALRFAARDSTSLSPSADEVNTYFERWQRVVAAEPILTGRLPQRYRGLGSATFLVFPERGTTLMSKWCFERDTLGPNLTIGVPEVDAVLLQLRHPRIHSASCPPTQVPPWVLITVDQIVNEEALNNSLLIGGARLPDPKPRPSDDGSWTWNGNTAQIDFTFGWGPCAVACDGLRHLRAIVPFVGRATVYDLGGDPLPPGLELSPDTRPLLPSASQAP